jgi:hypothetical protein
MKTIRVPGDWRFGRIREDIDNRRLWKARDRLHGYLVEEPANQDVLDMLGAIWFEMGDLPQAGRYWWLTERDDEPAIAARAAFYERFGKRAGQVIRALPRPTRPDLYPAPVQARLEALVAGLTMAFVWRPPGWTPPVDDALADRHLPRQLRTGQIVLLATCLAVITLLVVGLVTIVGWLVRLVT